MMPVDTSIYQNLLRAPKSVADYDAEWQGQQANALTLQKARNALAMQSQEMEAAQRSAQEAGAFNNALRGIDLNTPEGQRAAMHANPARALPLLTSNAKLQDQYAETRGRDATAMKTMADAVSKKLDMQRDQLRFVQTPQQAAAWMQAAYADPELGPIVQRLGPIEQLVQSIPRDPQGLQNWVLQASEGAAKLRERVNAEATQGETVRRNKATEGIQIRGQNMTDARQREAQALSRERLNFDKAGGVGAVAKPSKPLPTAALKMQQEALDAIGVSGTINADLKALEGQIDKGALKFGPVSNLKNQGLNLAGISSEESRNFATFKSNMERLRNESLRLNTGVQTDGDAQRAWNELFQNINDTDLVKQRLGEIQRINKRGAELQRLKVDGIRANYGADPLDVSPQMNQPPALDGGVPKFDADKERRYQEWKAKQK